MLNANEQETHLSHKPRYKFVTPTMLSLMNQTHICYLSTSKLNDSAANFFREPDYTEKSHVEFFT